MQKSVSKKWSFFLRLATLSTENSGPFFFALPVFSDHCACRPVRSFSRGQDITRFSHLPLPGSNVLIDLGIETVSRFCTD